jgi:hypothetical protein
MIMYVFLRNVDFRHGNFFKNILLWSYSKGTKILVHMLFKYVNPLRLIINSLLQLNSFVVVVVYRFFFLVLRALRNLFHILTPLFHL